MDKNEHKMADDFFENKNQEKDIENERLGEKEKSPEGEIENIENLELEGNDVIVDGLSRFSQIKESFLLSKESYKLEYEERLRSLHSQVRGIMDTAEEKIFSLMDSVDRDAFRPQVELRRIRKCPPEDRLSKIGKLKEEVKTHIENMASLQSKALEIVQENPDISKEDLLKTVDGDINGIRMSSREKSLARKIVNAYCEHHALLKKNLEKYKSGEDLYRALTKSEPEGNFDILVGPVSVYLKCSSSKDFGVLFSSAGLKEGESLGEIMALQGKNAESMVGGVSFKKTAIGMDGMITAENSSLVDSQEESDEFFSHEEEHAIRNIFDNILIREKNIGWCPDLHKIKMEDREKIFRSFLRKRRRLAENSAKDEFLAYLSMGSSTEKILGKLNDEFTYDFLGLYKSIDLPYDNLFNAETDKKEIIEEVYTSEYGTNLRDAAEAIDVLKGAEYSVDDIIAIFTYEPLERWKKTAARLVQS